MKQPGSPDHRALCDVFHRAIELVGKRWTGAIIFMLLGPPRRYAELRSAIPEITDRMLSDRLQELEREGILTREVFPETPVRVEYALTDKGRALANAFEAIGSWAHDWLEAPKKNATRGRAAGGAKPQRRPASSK